jgi:hypothetical protein
MDLETKVIELTGVVTEKAIDVVDDVKEETEKVLELVDDVVDDVKEQAEKELKKAGELFDDTTEKVKDSIKQLEGRLVEEVKKSKCCLPFTFLFDKYSRTQKPILSTREVTESTVSK